MSEQDLLDLLNTNEDNDNDDNNDNVNLDDLKSELEALKKENQGLLKAKQEEKRKRQDTQTRLGRIEESLDKILDTKSKTSNDDTNKQTINGVPVEFTADGEAFIPNEKLNEVLAPYQKRIQSLQQDLTATKKETQSSLEADKMVQSILGEDERYPSVYTKYQKARDWVNKQVIEYQKENNLKGFMTSTDALELVFGDDPTLEEQFGKEFPGMNLDSVVIAHESKRLFRRMLNEHVNTNDSNKKNDDEERFKKVLKKPSGLGESANANNDLNVLDKLENLSTDDIMNLTDEQAKALEKALLDEELKGR